MDVMDAIYSRRSIRSYTDQPVSDDLIETLLRAAMAAPSAGNEQPWHFLVIRDRELLDKIPTFHPYSKMLKQAPVAVLICGDLDRQQHEGYWTQDCSAATQNLLLAATANGLGTCWLGIYPVDERVSGMRDLLGIPDHVVPFSLTAIGYPAEQKGREDRYDASRVHQDRW